MLEKKDFVNASKGVHKQKLELARFLYCFQRKTPKSKYWVLKVLCLETQMVYSSRLKNESLCVCVCVYEALIKMLCCLSMQWTET